MTELMIAVDDWALALAGTPWVFLAVYAFATIDGFFPPIPSESVIIALAAAFIANGTPDFWILGAVAAAGAFCGDQIAYSIGQRIPVRRLRFMQGSKARHAVDWAETALAERGASFIIAARYVPIGRVAVNMTAGSVGYPRRRFSLMASVAAVSWSIYSVLLGVGAGHLFGKEYTLLAMVVGVVGGLVLGVVVDQVIQRIGRRRGRPVGGEFAADDAGDTDAGATDAGAADAGVTDDAADTGGATVVGPGQVGATSELA